MAFEWPIRVYVEDTDAGGIVYYANYLRYLERARSEWLRHLGFEQQSLMENGVRFVVRDVSIQYRKPAVVDDEVIATVDLIDATKAGLTLNQTVVTRSDSQKDKQEILVDAQIRIACINNEGRPTAIPADVATLMTKS